MTQPAFRNDKPFAVFMPSPAINPASAESYGAWWSFSEVCLRRMIEVLGFDIAGETRASHLCTGRNPAAAVECLTLVARRR